MPLMSPLEVLGRQVAAQRARALAMESDLRLPPQLMAAHWREGARGLWNATQDHLGVSPTLYGLVGAEAAARGAGRRLRVNWGGFGRLKAQDVPTGQIYDLQAGEVPPGLRKPAGYTPEEAEAVLSSRPSIEALRRAGRLTGSLSGS